MVPISLSLKNFLSYGPELQTIHFGPYALICLSGKNGHGKSALLDAMTWAVWGQARKMAGAMRADESLLRLSEYEMLVIFEFASNGYRYRVKREFVRSGNKGIATLDFGLLSEESEKTIALTGKTIRETQATIEKIIGLDFETFVNSAFLRQGGAGEFCRKSPRERKEILARILSLDHYEMIKKSALEKVKNTSIERDLIMHTQQKRKTEKQEYADVDKQVQQLYNVLDVTLQKEIQLKQQCAPMQHMLSQIKSEILYYQTEVIKKRQLQEEKMALVAQLRQLRFEWKSCIAAHIVSQKIIPLLQKKQNVMRVVLLQKELLDQKMMLQQELVILKEKQHQIVREYETKNYALKERYAVECESLKRAMESVHEAVQAVQGEISEIEIECNVYAQRVNFLAKSKELITQKRNECVFFIKRSEKRVALIDKVLGKKSYYQALNQDLEKKMSLLCDEQCAVCPICDHDLSPEKRQQLHQSIETQKHNIECMLSRLAMLHSHLEPYQALYREYKKRELMMNREAEAVQLQHGECAIMQSQLHERKIRLQEQLSKLGERQEMLLQKRGELHEQFVSKQISEIDDTAYNQIIMSVAATQKAIQEHVYDEPSYTNACHELQQLEECIAKSDEESIKRSMFTLKERIKTGCLLLRKNNQEQSRSNFATEKLQSLEQKESILKQKEAQYVASLDLLQEKKEQLLHEKGNLEMRQRLMQLISESYDRDEQRLLVLQRDIDQYMIIAHTTGKDGIQALLIEQSIPEIEYEANVILSRLTHNQMQLFIESVKDLKSGKAKETLDIKISDSEGVRSYDLFSGGEAFRIDLALRIGISKLLANRAGTTLETLIIDEGFGSQDEEGISLVVDSLYKIQDDFKKIIIVSHLASIKEQIPVHFIVTKTASGSSVQVLH